MAKLDDILKKLKEEYGEDILKKLEKKYIKKNNKKNIVIIDDDDDKKIPNKKISNKKISNKKTKSKKNYKKLHAPNRYIDIYNEVKKIPKDKFKKIDNIKFYDRQIKDFLYRFVIGRFADVKRLYNKIKKSINIKFDDIFYKKEGKREIQILKPSFIKIYLRDFKNRKNRVVSVNISYLETLEDFNNYLLNINKYIVGSDKIDTNNYEFLPRFDIVYRTFYKVGNKYNKSKFYDTIEIKKGVNCVDETCKHFNISKPDDYDVISIINHFKNNNINIVYDKVYKYPNYDEYINNKNKKLMDIYKFNKLVKRKKLIKINDYEELKNTVLIYGNAKCETDKYHIEPVKGRLCSYNDESNIYTGINSKKLELVYISDNDKNINKEHIRYQNYYCIFDIETVFDITHENVFIPYSISYLIIDKTNLNKLLDLDKSQKDIYTSDIYLNCKKKFYFGFDCIKKFVYDIDILKGYQLCFIGFNNSNFDNYFLINELININGFCPKDIFYFNNSILNFKWKGHDTFDLSRHLIGSLDSNCKNFKIFNCKTSFDHKEAQERYQVNKLFDEEFINKVEKYNNFDVISTALLFCEYSNIIENISFFNILTTSEDYKIKDITHYKTIGSLMWGIINDYWYDNNIKIPKFNNNQIKYYEDILKYKSAGRCDLSEDIPRKIKGKIFSLDVKSMYPYQMVVNKNMYPYGDIIDTDKFIIDKIGYYYCDVDQSNLKGDKKIQCEKVFKSDVLEKNNWCTKNILNDYFLNTERINKLISLGCKVTIKNGFYFSECIRGFDLFYPLINVMKIKTDQDKLKSNKSNKYNPSLRETSKLLMNCISGKVIEGLHLKTVKYINYDDFINDVENQKHNIINVSDDYIMLEHTRDINDVFKNHRPVFYGDLIYTYSQHYLYDHLINYGSFYMDTDSGKISGKKALNCINHLKNTNIICWDEFKEIDERYKNATLYDDNGLFGQFEDELEGVNQSCSYFNKKKEYAIIDKDNEKSKIIMKGVSIKYNNGKIISNDIYLNDDEYEKIKNMNTNEQIKYYDENKKNINDWENIFNNLVVNKKEVKFLSTQFMKHVKNMSNTSIMDIDKFKNNSNTISLEPRIKIIKPNYNKYKRT